MSVDDLSSFATVTDRKPCIDIDLVVSTKTKAPAIARACRRPSHSQSTKTAGNANTIGAI